MKLESWGCTIGSSLRIQRFVWYSTSLMEVMLNSVATFISPSYFLPLIYPLRYLEFVSQNGIQAI
jgi:hypothetical protein